MRLYVARHGETDWNREGRYQGQLESRLTDLGRRQAEALAGALTSSGAARVVSSPLSRCFDTASSVAATLKLEAKTDPLLLEISHGTWEGRLRAEIERDDAQRMHDWRDAPETVRFENGEALADVAARWNAFAASLVSQGDTIAVTHDVVVRLAILAATDRPLSDFWKPRVENGGYALLERHGNRWQLLEECHTAHLDGLLADTSRQAL